jgi:predicted metal-dependent phosphoesterase TrpH
VPGAELSCRYAGISLHLLGYLFDEHEPTFRSAREEVRESRRLRGRRIVDKLNAAGYPVTWEEIAADAAGGTVGRPHVARALVRHGLVATVDEAFGAQWLGARGRYWEPKLEMDALDAVRMVRRAGGVPVFAHPLATKRGRTVGDDVIAAMAEAGLAGLEVDHVDQTEVERGHLRDVARQLDLFVTGSSDFHGSNKTVRLGAQTTDPAAYAMLLAQATGAAPVAG